MHVPIERAILECSGLSERLMLVIAFRLIAEMSVMEHSIDVCAHVYRCGRSDNNRVFNSLDDLQKGKPKRNGA